MPLPPFSSHKGSGTDPHVVVPDGYDLRCFEEIDSTNEEALRLARGSLTRPTWIWAERQTAGRGRRGRVWISQTQNLFCTLVMPVDRPPAVTAQLSFLTALAVRRLVASYSSASAVKMKWPNDVLLEGKKISGILLEAVGGGSGQPALIAVGVGVNLMFHPNETDFPATALASVCDPPSPLCALEELMRHFDDWLGIWMTSGFGPIRRAWLSAAHGLGQEIEVRLPGRTLTGVFDTISETGELVLINSDGDKIKIAAGDVFFGNE